MFISPKNNKICCTIIWQDRVHITGVGANRRLITQIFSPKKTGFSLVKNTSQFFFDFCLPLFYAFAHENLKKKRASKVAHNRQKPFFFTVQPTAKN